MENKVKTPEPTKLEQEILEEKIQNFRLTGLTMKKGELKRFQSNYEQEKEDEKRLDFADQGKISCQRNHCGWRIFPEPEKVALQAQKLLGSAPS